MSRCAITLSLKAHTHPRACQQHKRSTRASSLKEVTRVSTTENELLGTAQGCSIACPKLNAAHNRLRRSQVERSSLLNQLQAVWEHVGSKSAGAYDMHLYLPVNFFIFKFSIVWEPAARGHRAYTDLSAARVRGPALYIIYAQSAALSTASGK